MEEDGHGIDVLEGMDVQGSVILFSSNFIDRMCVAALAPAVITMSGSIFHHRAAMFSIKSL